VLRKVDRQKGNAMTTTFYEILEVATDATRDAIFTAYRLKIAGLFQMIKAGASDEANTKRKQIDHAWEVLQEPKSRAAYNTQIGVTVAFCRNDFELMFAQGCAPSHEIAVKTTQLKLLTDAITDLAPLRYFPNLENVDIRSRGVTSLKWLAEIPTLRSAWISCPNVTDFSPLAAFTAFEYLYLESMPITDFSFLRGFDSLTELGIMSAAVNDLSTLPPLPALKRLYLNDTAIKDLTPLARFPTLETLFLRGTRIADVSPLASLTALQNLAIENTPVSDLSPLASLACLSKIDVESEARGLALAKTLGQRGHVLWWPNKPD
jgi:hypothetical protein